MPTQALCAGRDIPAVPSSTPTPGAYNYEAIERSGPGVYEVECYANVNGADLLTITGPVTLEDCVDECDQFNTLAGGIPPTCVGAVIRNNNCVLKSDYGIPVLDLGIPSVRLIEAPLYPEINDQINLVPNIASNTLCAGPASTAFAFQTAVAQRSFDNANAWTPVAGDAFKYEIECQREITVGAPLAPTFQADFETLFGITLANGVYEDCLRFCEYTNERATFTCIGFNFSPGNCDLFSSVTTVSDAPGFFGGRIFGSGDGYNEVGDRPPS